jgi:uncharacterized membrane protein YjgN (DUF898 family)
MTLHEPSGPKELNAPQAMPEVPAIGLAVMTLAQGAATSAVQDAPAATFGQAKPQTPSTSQTRYPVSFTGSGSEYFRIWIVNLLLTIVTLGIYYPWAALRKRRYFYNNTHVAGHSFDFHGSPTSMLRGYALMAVLFVLYTVVGQFSPTMGLVVLLAIGCLYPALVWAGQRFRLSQTSWRGLRFGFTGSMAGAYKALVAPALLMALGVGLLALSGLMAPELDSTGPVSTQAEEAAEKTSAIAATFVSLGMLVVVASWPLLLWSIKRYQHKHLALGSVRSSFDAGVGPFYGAHIKAVLLTTLVASIVGIVAAVVLGVLGVAGGILGSVLGAGTGSGGLGSSMVLFAVLMVLAIVAFYLFVAFVPQPFITSRLQNLVWNRTTSTKIGFESKLRFRTLFGLGIKNWLLMVLTLGFYWPFAAVAMAKARLEAVTVLAPHGLDSMERGTDGASQDAVGDAAVDLFGVDIGM